MTTDTPNRHPLTWPDGTARTPGNKRDDGRQFKISFDKAVKDLLDELRQIGARKHAHTDVGGGEELIRALNNARDAAKKEFGQ